MMKITKKYKTKKRLKTLSQTEQSNSLLKNIEGAGILSEIHPIAAGVYNTTYFVIIPHRPDSNKGNIVTESEYCHNPNTTLTKPSLA